MDEEQKKLLGLDQAITRRDFLNGVAFSIAAAAGGSLLQASPGNNQAQAADLFAQDKPGYYPPALMGMRGSTEGSFEPAHALRDGNFWEAAGKPTDSNEKYDLVIVGAGASGLAAAYFYRKENPSAKILIVDNHEDFGGHATRNEFKVDGRMLLANGGSAEIDSPFPYSKVAHGLMDELGIFPVELTKNCVQDPYHDLKTAIFFDKETFGNDRLVPGDPVRPGTAEEWRSYLSATPLSAEVKKDILRLYDESVDLLPGLSGEEKKDKLTRLSYKDFLLNVAKVHPEVLPFYQTETHQLYGVGIDAVNALDCWAEHLPGFAGMKLPPGAHKRMGYSAAGMVTPKDPYFFHFPDGNATVIRLLLRSLISGMLPGKNDEDIVLSPADYSKLDQAENAVRIRLGSIAAKVEHVGEPGSAKEVEVTYTREKKLYSVKAKGVVLACWNGIIPLICTQLPDAQKEALRYGVKVPLVYTNVAVRNWTAFKNLGVSQINSPGMYHLFVSLDRALKIDGYKTALAPSEPMVLRMQRTPCSPGLPERFQHKMGRGELLSTPFETFETKIRDQLNRILKPGGFDAARDIVGITVNRWPHGYAYEYNYLFDTEWPEGQHPCEIGRKPFGRITIANSDAGAKAYLDQAIDQAYRAVQELPKS